MFDLNTLSLFIFVNIILKRKSSQLSFNFLQWFWIVAYFNGFCDKIIGVELFPGKTGNILAT